MTLRTMEWKTYLDARRAGDFMLSRQSWDATYNDASSFLNTLKSDSEENVGHWKNAQYDALLNQATQITDATKRNALYQQAEVIINQQAPLIPIYYQPLIKLLKPYVGGFRCIIPRIMSTAKSCISRHIDAFIAVGARPAALFTLISCDSTRQIM